MHRAYYGVKALACKRLTSKWRTRPAFPNTFLDSTYVGFIWVLDGIHVGTGGF